MARKGRRTPVDARSTGRKRGRLTLIKTARPFYCEECGFGPHNFPETYPEKYRDNDLLAPVEKRSHVIKLECNHINKNILDCDPANLEWLCVSCHKKKDMQTEKGVSVIDDEFGYGINPFDLT